MLPGVDVIVYSVICEFPLLSGTDHDNDAFASSGVATTFFGADGIVLGIFGITAFVGPDAADVPTSLVAVTVNVYDVPFVSPVTVAVRISPATVAMNPPGLDVTV